MTLPSLVITKHQSYVIISIAQVIQGLEGLEMKNKCQIHLLWGSIIRNGISRKRTA